MCGMCTWGQQLLRLSSPLFKRSMCVETLTDPSLSEHVQRKMYNCEKWLCYNGLYTVVLLVPGVQLWLNQVSEVNSMLHWVSNIRLTQRTSSDKPGNFQYYSSSVATEHQECWHLKQGFKNVQNKYWKILLSVNVEISNTILLHTNPNVSVKHFSVSPQLRIKNPFWRTGCWWF